jgi:hypothetical protein
MLVYQRVFGIDVGSGLEFGEVHVVELDCSGENPKHPKSPGSAVVPPCQKQNLTQLRPCVVKSHGALEVRGQESEKHGKWMQLDANAS